MFGKRRFQHTQVWKRRVRTAASAPYSEKEIVIAVGWNIDEIPPSKTQAKDPILWGIWVLRSDWTYIVSQKKDGNGEWHNTQYFKLKTGAVKEYRRRVKEFPRSKEVDYGFPIRENALF